MSEHADFDENASNRTFDAPYTSDHPIPTVQKYHERLQRRHEHERATGDEEEPQSHSVINSIKAHVPGLKAEPSSSRREPYQSQNRNADAPSAETDGTDYGNCPVDRPHQLGNGDGKPAIDPALDAKQKRKQMKKMDRDHEGRQTTDPVTHLPVTVHDFTVEELNNSPENEPSFGSQARTSTGFSAASKDDAQLSRETEEGEASHRGMEQLFPPPDFQAMKAQLKSVYSTAIMIGFSAIACLVSLVALINSHMLGSKGEEQSSSLLTVRPILVYSISSFTIVAISYAVAWGVRDWMNHKLDTIWEDEIWESARQQEQSTAGSVTPESTQWLNSLLASVWPLINPELFTSLADTLEDTMQASLPKMVRMVSIDDLGQGSEAIRLLGVRWLPTGAAAKNVSADGKLEQSKQKHNDRTVPGEGEVDSKAKADADDEPGDDHDGKEDDNQNAQEAEEMEGLEAEEGDFVNLEVAFSYRASSSGKGIKKKAKNAHLYLAFYLPAGIQIPVWVELQGIVGVMRMRLQLCPDPPFFSLCTITLLGQPKANLSCLPLTKHGLNIMDLPLISSFVQSSIDAALAEYVAPKSLTLDLKDMLVGDDFKKDTAHRGAIVVTIKRANGFKEGDGNLGSLKKGSADPYVTVGWAKFGKPVWASRVILNDMEPVWNETTFVLVGPEELNARERLQVQIWDSDRNSADDNLGRVEVDLGDLMRNSRSRGRICDRQDEFIAQDAGEKMPGTIEWSVGYFGKVALQDEQMAQQKIEPDAKSVQQLKDKISNNAENKLRESADRKETRELDQQKAQDFKAREDQIIISLAPPSQFPLGILSIQVHNITGLQFEKISKNKDEGNEGDDTEEGEDDLPSSYCAIILNHQKVFKTRTKPKNSKPFFNAGCERVVRDWRTTQVMISVRDSRVHEDDPLLGIVFLDLLQLFSKRCQIKDQFPLVGGIGYGKATVSLMFRSLDLRLPRQLLGWDYGTLEITEASSRDLSENLQGLRLKLRSSVNHGKMYANSGNGTWTGKHGRTIRLAVRKRYSSCLIVEFRKNSIAMDKTPAFATLWLKDIPDDEETTVNLAVWGGGEASLKRAQANCLTEDGDTKGSLQLTLKFRHGLSSVHRRLASKNPNLKDVMEVLDTASDNKEVRDKMDGDSSSSDSSDSDSDTEAKKVESNGHDSELQEDGRRGPIQQMKDYKDHHEQLHRQHRGVMQWKGARTAQWMKTKVEHGKDHVEDVFRHKDRDPGIETEV